MVPPADALCARVAVLLAAARRRSMPVAHVQTLTRADGSDAMPHWRRLGRSECVEGTRGALPPPALTPADGELVVRKRFFSAFADPRLDPWLRERQVGRLLVAGVYLHGCVRAAVLDAYERGYEVAVVDDAVGTTSPCTRRSPAPTSPSAPRRSCARTPSSPSSSRPPRRRPRPRACRPP